MEVNERYYRAALRKLEHDIAFDLVSGNVRLHCLQYTPDGRPKTDTLAQVLFRHICHYALSARTWDREETEMTELTAIVKRAMDTFRKEEKSGEVGELLTYFLIETVLEAPQVIAKMETQPNPNLEIPGSDGMHVRQIGDSPVLEAFFAESKLHKDVKGAIRSVCSSIESMQESNVDKREIDIATAHFKWLDEELESQLDEAFDQTQPSGGDYVVRHVCLVGYNKEDYPLGPGEDAERLVRELSKSLRSNAEEYASYFEEKVQKHDLHHLQFEFFLLPFESVQEFRDSFYKELES